MDQFQRSRTFQTAAEQLPEDVMVDARKVLPDIHFRIPWKSSEMSLRASHGSSGTATGQARECVGDQSAFQQRANMPHQSMLQNTLTEAGRRNQARFGIANAKCPALTDPDRAVKNVSSQPPRFGSRLSRKERTS
jgi:hypothetical protein